MGFSGKPRSMERCLGNVRSDVDLRTLHEVGIIGILQKIEDLIWIPPLQMCSK